jgi:hypothetical protein
VTAESRQVGDGPYLGAKTTAPDARAGRFAAPRTEECLSDGLEGLQSAGMTTTLPPAGPDAYGTDPGDPIRARTIGGAGELLSPEEITRSVRGAFSTHISHLEAPVRRVLSIMPTKYEDIWTAAKGFDKLEPIVADGGELIIYAPHITRVSVTHPKIAEIGYHNRDYFLGQWERFQHQPWGDLAHSTHLRGQGTWDAEHGKRDG